MDEQQIEEIADRVVEALNGLAPGEPEWWEIVAGFGSYAALAAAIVALIIGSRTRRLTQLRREISLAQLRVVLDRELGRTTPDGVVTLSRIPLPPLSALPDGPLRTLPS